MKKKSIKKIAFMVMRLQPQHNGHTQLILKAMLENDQVIILLGSSQEKRTKRNPLSTPEKISLLKQTFGESSKLKIITIRDIGATTDQEWTNHVFDTIEKAGLKQPNRYYAGDSVNASFFRNIINPYAFEEIEVIEIDRFNSGLMSATDIRNSIYNGCNSWEKHVPPCIIQMIKDIYPEELINPFKIKKIKGIKKNKGEQDEADKYSWNNC